MIQALIVQQIVRQVATQAVKQVVQQMVQQMVQKLVQQMVGQMIQQMVQQLAQQMGMSGNEANQTAKSMMEQLGFEGGNNQGSIRETLNEVSQQLGLSPRQQGEMTRSVEDFVNESVRQGVKDAMEGANVENKGRRNGRGGATKGGGDFFTLLAEILGRKINSGFTDMKNLADATNWKDPKQATDFQAQQQKFGYFMQSLSTALKTVGEALANVARKQ
jgi:hypothetical protein